MTLELHTQRLRLTPLTGDDAQALFSYRRLPEVTRFQNFVPAGVADAEAFIASVQGRDLGASDQWCQLAVRLRETDELVGDVGVQRMSHGAKQAEIGFTVAPSHQRRGLAMEAVTALLGHLFGELDLHRVTASVDPENVGSCALLERLGMRREAHHVRSYWFRGAWVDDVVYAMLRTEWSNARP